jgi:ligand-binding sensor domain-containing protein
MKGMRTLWTVAGGLLFLVVCAGSAKAGWYTYLASDGLANNSVHSILEDRYGDLWFASFSGLNRYDGARWKYYGMNDGLSANNAFALFEDHSGNIWIGTEQGVTKYDGVSFSMFRSADGLADDWVNAIGEDRSGNMWFGTWSGLSRYDGSSWRTFTTADGLAGDYVSSILEDRSGNLWFGTWSGLSRYDGSSWRTFTTADGLAGEYVSSILEDRSGNLWFGTYGGVSRYDGVGWRTFTAADGLADNSVNSILEDRSGNLWFGTYGGVSRYDGVSWRTFTTADGLADNFVSTIEQDGSGNLWFGHGVWSVGGGVTRYDGVYSRTFTDTGGRANTVFVDRSGRLWAGTDVGAWCYDAGAWSMYTSENGLTRGPVRAISQDRNGDMWFGTYGGGASRFDGVEFWPYNTSRGLAGNYVLTILADRSGNLWFGTETGVTQYSMPGWRTFRTANGLCSNYVCAIEEDRSGNLWFGSRDEYSPDGGCGVSRYDGAGWQTYTRPNGPWSYWINDIEADRAGNVWFATGDLGIGYSGLNRYDGLTWRNFTTEDGLTANLVQAIEEDSQGHLWSGTAVGVSRYDGTRWWKCGAADGSGITGVTTIASDSSGNLWFGTDAGITYLEPDRVPPQTVILGRPAGVSMSTAQTITFSAAYGEIEGIGFSCSFDGGPWSDWSRTGFWQTINLSDGEHVFMVKAHDEVGNVDPTPVVCTFEIDATPPMAVIASPSFGQAVQGSFSVVGRAADPRFKDYRVECRVLEGGAWASLAESMEPVENGMLCEWNTSDLPDGPYEIRLSVSDTLGLTGSALAAVIVDNLAPWANETAPAVLRAATGGSIYTTNREVHLYFPPHAFTQDTEVNIGPSLESEVPDTLEDGAVRVLPGYEVSWGDAALEKPGTIEMSYAGLAGLLADPSSSPKRPLAEGVLALYASGSDSTWQRLGGTVDGSTQVISSPLKERGRYAIFEETAAMAGSWALSDLAVTPRVFSPRGNFASDEAVISFTLGRPGPVTVKIYNRAGRLVREVASGQQMNAGANLVRWDGRDSEANQVEDGLYLVVVEALGEKQTRTLAVVR